MLTDQHTLLCLLLLYGGSAPPNVCVCVWQHKEEINCLSASNNATANSNDSPNSESAAAAIRKTNIYSNKNSPSRSTGIQPAIGSRK